MKHILQTSAARRPFSGLSSRYPLWQSNAGRRLAPLTPYVAAEIAVALKRDGLAHWLSAVAVDHQRNYILHIRNPLPKTPQNATAAGFIYRNLRNEGGAAKWLAECSPLHQVYLPEGCGHNAPSHYPTLGAAVSGLARHCERAANRPAPAPVGDAPTPPP